MTRPRRLRRTTAVQCPYIAARVGPAGGDDVTWGVARWQGRRADPRRRPARRRRRRRGLAGAVLRPRRRSTARRRRHAGRRRSTPAPMSAAAIDRGQCSTTMPSGWALRQPATTDQRRAATTARRPDDEDVLAIGHLQARRATSVANSTPIDGAVTPSWSDAGASGVDVVAEDADRPGAAPWRRRGPPRGQRQHGQLRLERRSDDDDPTRDGRRHGRGTDAERAHSTGSSTWNSHRCVSAPARRGRRRRAARAWPRCGSRRQRRR